MKVIVFGSKGMLGSELSRQLQDETLFKFDAEDVDVTDKTAVQNKILEIKPDWIFNCVAYNAVDKAEEATENVKALKLNSEAVGFMAEAAEKVGAVFIQYSTGFIFNGSSTTGYIEEDIPDPQSNYARSKLLGEEQAQKASKHYIIRLNLLFGPAGESELAKKSFPDQILELAKTKNSFDFVADEISTPTYSVDLAVASIKLVKEKYPYGIYHLPNSGQASWFDFAQEVFKLKGVDVKLIPVGSSSFSRPAKRPANSVLINNKFPKLRSWQEALKEYL